MSNAGWTGFQFELQSRLLDAPDVVRVVYDVSLGDGRRVGLEAGVLGETVSVRPCGAPASSRGERMDNAGWTGIQFKLHSWHESVQPLVIDALITPVPDWLLCARDVDRVV